MDEKRGVSSEPASISPVCFFLDDFSIFHVFFSLLLFQFAYGFLFFFFNCLWGCSSCRERSVREVDQKIKMN